MKGARIVLLVFYGLARMESLFDSPQGLDFYPLECFNSGSGTHPASIQWVLGVLSSGVKTGSLKVIRHLHLVPTLRMSGDKPSLLHTPSWRVQGHLYIHWDLKR
jgi:hypothetical protein